MKCTYPRTLGRGAAYACGECFSCRLNKRRELQHRIILEAACHKENAFVTLTYEDVNLPLNGIGMPTLRHSDIQLFLKRLRATLAPLKVRFFVAGEYGDLTMRPHYHVAIFGFPHCHRLMLPRRTPCCSVCTTISNAWGLGQILVGSLTPDSSQYVAGYTVKKMTSDDHAKLRRDCPSCLVSVPVAPEYAKWSIGLGRAAMWDLASTLLALDYCEADVPSALRYGKKILPLGRYLRRELRHMMGRPRNAPQETLDAMAAELSIVRDVAFSTSQSFQKVLIALREGDAASVASRFSATNKRRSL